jgi:prepilin-type N-terminal cleavage/methylation domain-containing protein
MNKTHKGTRKGFTLLEILLVIAAIGILAAIVLVAINPNRQISLVRNATRRSDINTIYKALEQYLIDTGRYPLIVNTNNCVDITKLVPDYLPAIPSDPTGGTYQVYINQENNRIGVEAPSSELNQSIVVNPQPPIQVLTGDKYNVSGSVVGSAISPNGQYMAFTHQTGDRLKVYYHPEGRFDSICDDLQVIDDQKYAFNVTPNRVSFSPNGNYMAVVADNAQQSLTIFYHPEGRFEDTGGDLQKLTGGKFATQDSTRDVCFSPNGKFLALPNRGSNRLRVLYHPDGRFDLSDEIQVYNATGPSSSGNYAFINGEPLTCAFSPNGNYLAVAGGIPSKFTLFYHPEGNFNIPSEVKMFNDASWNQNQIPQYNLLGGSNIGTARSIAFSPNGKYMVISMANRVTDNLFVFYHPEGRFDLSGGLERFSDTSTISSGPHPIYNINGSNAWMVNFSPNGKYFAVANSGSNRINLFYHPTGSFNLTGEVQNLTGGKYYVDGTGLAVTFSPNGNYLALGHAGTNKINLFYNQNGIFHLRY